MSLIKKLSLVTYVILAILAFTQAGTGVGIWSLRILGLLAVVHLIEVVAFFKFCQSAGGSLGGHLLNVFLFGIIHVNEVKAAQQTG